MNRVREELKNLYQEPGELITVFIYKYGQMHYLSTGYLGLTGRHIHLQLQIHCSIGGEEVCQCKRKPNTLEAIFQMAEQCSKKMLEADSFDHSNTFRVPSTINEISDAEINEVSQGHWNNTRNDDNKNGGKYTQKNQYYTGKKDFNKKPWHGKTRTKNHGTKIIRNNMVTRSPNPKMLALPLLKMLSIFAPQVFNEGIFNAVTKLLHKKVEEAKRSGSDNAKTINAIEHDNFCNFFKIPE